MDDGKEAWPVDDERAVMSDEDTQNKILRLLDVLSVEVGAIRTEMRGGFERVDAEIGELRAENRAGFDRVERRLGSLETRVEGIENESRAFREEIAQRVSSLEARSG